MIGLQDINLLQCLEPRQKTPNPPSNSHLTAINKGGFVQKENCRVITL